MKHTLRDQYTEIEDLLTESIEDGGCGCEWTENESQTFIDNNMIHVVKSYEYELNPYDSVAYIFWKLGLSQFSPTESDVYLSQLPLLISKHS